MTRSSYFTLCMAQSADFLKLNLKSPSVGQRRRHLDLIRLALRKKGIRA